MMEGKKTNYRLTRPRVLLVFGAPCSGKTTFAKKFAEKFRLAFYDLDEIKSSNEFSEKQLLNILELISRTGQNLIFEGCLETEKQRDEIRKVFRIAGYDPSLIWIQTDLSTIRTRLKARHKSVAKAKEMYDTAIATFEAPTEIEMPIILSGKHTFDTQAKHVITALADN